jgi:undecaprenyl-diphosphatase
MLFGWRKDPEIRQDGFKLLWAFFVTSVLGLVAKKMGFDLPENPWPVALAAIIGGLVIFVAEYRIKKTQPHDHLSWWIVTAVGVAQVLAIIFPGTSRSGACIIFAMLGGLNRVKATEFSFILGIPTIFAATLYSFYKYYKEFGGIEMHMLGDIALGFVVSCVVAFIAVKWLLRYVQTHTLNAFAWYRLALGGLILFLLY